jgi:Eukaryotic cytochrome b561
MSAHGWLMLIACGVMMPLGVIIARYYKVIKPTDLDNKFWWHSHLFLQITSIILSYYAFFLVFRGGFDHLHGQLGGVSIILITLQLLSGLFRGSRETHFNMTLYRRVFEAFHKTTGWLLLILLPYNLASGLIIIGEYRIIYILFSWYFVLILWCIYCIKTKKHVPTHQAIWGKHHVL